MEENKFPEENINNETREEAVVESENTEEAGITMQIDGLGDGETKKMIYKEIFEWIQAGVVAVVIAMFLRTFVVTMVQVDGASMEPTFHHAQRLAVTRFNNEYKQGDVIIFRPVREPERPYIKRVIATEGQTVSFDFDKGTVLVDGVEIYEPYIKETIESYRFGSFNPYTKTSEVVPEDHLFVMGDNRNNSSDSRAADVGMVHKDAVIGKAVLRWWPLNEFTVDFDGK